jgi:5-methylcytosine-specific restriction endonuclease McrA
MALRTLPSRLKPAAQARASFPKTEGGKNAAHYQTEEHRKWRLAVLKRDGLACVKCGATGHGVRLIADHIRELEDGGAPLDPANGQTLCLACSNRKTAASRRTRLGRPQGVGV